MSEPIPESVPTSQDPRSKRPTKRRALTPASAQAAQLDALFAHPEREVQLPPSAEQRGRPRGGLAAPPEIVANVQGSSAGAGSGEFHVYKASRRREYERLRLMDEEVRRERETATFEKEREEKRVRDEEKTRKNKARREKAKARKARKGKGGKEGGEGKDGRDDDEEGEDSGMELDKGVKDGNADVKATAKGSDVDKNGEAAVSANPDEIGVVIHDDD